MLQIKDFRLINQAENIIVTQHGRKRLSERGILLADIMNAIATGEIIEQYTDDLPFPSALILGKASDTRLLHVVASVNEGMIYLITAYFPDGLVWKEDMRTRKDK